MTQLPHIIHLETDWRALAFAERPSLKDFSAGSEIAALSVYAPATEADSVWLSHVFYLEPTDYCVNYWLIIDSAPAGTEIYVNDTPVGHYPVGDSPVKFELNITDWVMLEDNHLVLHLPSGNTVGVVGVGLQPLPCD